MVVVHIGSVLSSRAFVFTMLDIVKAARLNATAAGLKSLTCAFLQEL